MTFLINSNAPSSAWLASTADFSQRNKRAAENVANEEKATDNLINSESVIPQNEETFLTSLINNATSKYEHDSVALINPLHHKLLTAIPLSPDDFSHVVNDEQLRLLCGLLSEEGYTTSQPCDIILAREFVNHVTDYLIRYKDNEEKRAKLVRLLLKPLGEYGANPEEKISSARQQAVIANWLQYAVLGMSCEAWILEQVSDIKSQGDSLFHHSSLQGRLFNQLNSQNESGKLSSETCAYFQQHVINHIMPTFMPQLEAHKDGKKLPGMMISQPEWDYLHAGLTLLQESGADIKGMSLEEISNNGILLAALLQEKFLPAEYNRYFKIPAMIHERLNREQSATPTLEMTDVYHNYFDYLTQYSQNNPFIKLISLSQNWKSRPALARQQLKTHDIDESWLNDYLYHNREVAFYNRQGKMTLLPNINTVFYKQNKEIAKFIEQTDKIVLPLAFNSIKQDEQIFIERAAIQLMKVEFNTIDSLRGVPLPRGARHGIMVSDKFVTKVLESIDMLKCTFNGQERMYVLTTEQGIGSYKLRRVNNNKDAILDLFDNDGKARNDYKLKTHPIMSLKNTNDKADILFEKLAKRHGEKLAQKLQNEGYHETTRQKVDAFFLSLIPFYTMITEAQKGNKGQAVLAGSPDLLGFLPFIGKGAQVGSRFSLAMGEEAVKELRTGLAQVTIRQALRERGKQFVKFGIPHIANRLPAKTYINLGGTFLRSADPGFELLTSGGIRGVNALKNAVQQLQHEIKGLNPLIKALEKKTQDLAAESVKSFDVEMAYSPELKKEVQIVNIGQQQGRDIWVQVSLENNTLFGRKYLRNSADELELAPVPIGERLYQLKTQGMGGEGANKVAQKWAAETKRVAGSTINAVRLDKQKELIVNRKANTGINLANEDLSHINFANYFNLFHIKVDLSSADLTGANLSNSKLYEIKLKKAKLDGANLAQSSLMHSNLTKASMVSANLREAKLNQAILKKVDLGSADLTKAILNGVDLTEAKLMNSKLEEAQIIYSKLNNADLNSADLNNALLIHADLTQANLAGAKLTAANMTAATLTKSNLTGTELGNANLTKAKLKKANLTKANMSGASILEADLTEATLIDTNLAGADLSDATLQELWICGANFTGAKLNNTFTLALPKWTENNLNTTLNHFDNKSSLLTSIDSIDNQYSELKIKLMLQLIRSLDKPSLNLTNVTFPLLDILRKEPFIINQDISLFVNKLVANLKNHALQFFSAAETAFHPVFQTNIKVAKIGQQQGNDIWIQIDPQRGALFGEKYYRDTENNLQLVPVEVQKQFLVAQPLSESQGKKVFIEQKTLSSTISTTSPAYYANNPSPLKQSLSRDDLDWILTSILKPAKELNTKGSGALASAGVFTFLNGGGRELANTFFHEVVNNAKHGKEGSMKASDLISRLISNGTEVNVDIYLRSIYDKPSIANGYLAAELGSIAREHPLDINAVRAKIYSMPPGECQMFFINNVHAITLARDNDNKLWLFDTALNPKISNYPSFRDFEKFTDRTKSGEDYATDLEAQAILDKYLHRIRKQTLIVSIKHK